MRTDNTKEAALEFIAANYDADKMRPLLNAIEQKSDYTQKRFWAIVDKSKTEKAGN
jgi:hypothetical protein